MYTQECLREDTLSNEHAYLVENDPLLKHKYGQNDLITNPASLNALLADIHQALGALDVLYNSYFESESPGMQSYDIKGAAVSTEFFESFEHDERAIAALIEIVSEKLQGMREHDASDNRQIKDMLQGNASQLMDTVRQIETRIEIYRNRGTSKHRQSSGLTQLQHTVTTVRNICRILSEKGFIKHFEHMQNGVDPDQPASLASHTSHRTQNNSNNNNNKINGDNERLGRNKNPAPALIKLFRVDDWIRNLLDIPNQQNICVHYVRSSVQNDFTINPLPYIGMSTADYVDVQKYSIKGFALRESVILSRVHSVHFTLRNFGDECERYIANWLRVISDNAYIPATQYNVRTRRVELPEKFIVLGCRDNTSFAGRLCLCGFFVDNRAKTLKFVFLVPNPISPRSAYV
jgi:ribosomal protein S8